MSKALSHVPASALFSLFGRRKRIDPSARAVAAERVGAFGKNSRNISRRCEKLGKQPLASLIASRRSRMKPSQIVEARARCDALCRRMTCFL
jgi:hypothetical protein